MGTDLRSFIVNLAMKLQGIPYIWGGSTPAGFDCSGFVIWILQVFNLLPSGDWSANGLAYHFKKVTGIEKGDLVLYGKANPNGQLVATHVMMYIGSGFVVGASGGDSTTTTLEEAKKKNAMVKIKPIDYRGDRLFVVNIFDPID